MLTLEQARAVNAGFQSGDLSTALAPLEETIDLRANELPRLDKPTVAALKDGLQNGDDAATWAQAIFHPNISVRRFARKVFMGIGDEAAPIFEPLRARLERFWGEETLLPESNKPREAALRREQNEQIASALEILLRANPEAFLEFYAQLADVAPLQNEQSVEMQKWQERNAAAWKATQEETDRLLKEEWGEKWAQSGERWKLPSRVLRELDERARAKPEIAQLWQALGENPWETVAPEWNSAGLLIATWSGYLSECETTGPIRRVNARLRPVLWDWVRAAFDFGRDQNERECMARRLMTRHLHYQFVNWIEGEVLLEQLPALLLRVKPNLLKFIQWGVKGHDGFDDPANRRGDQNLAALWISLAVSLGNKIRKPWDIDPKNWELPAIESQVLRNLLADTPENQRKFGGLGSLSDAAKEIEDARAAQDVPKVEAAAPTDFKYDEIGRGETFNLFRSVMSYGVSPQDARAKFDTFESRTLAFDDEKKIVSLVVPKTHLENARRALPRSLFWKVWARELGEGGAEKLKISLWPRAEPLLWAHFEERLQAHRKMETEPIEPHVKRKLTEREARAWRAQVRAQKREIIAQDVSDIADLLIEVDGLWAHLKAIELADRPHCREIRDQLERKLFSQLEQFPHGYNVSSVPSAPLVAWQQWKLDAQWDAILEKMEARLAEAKEEWTRNVLERELATGFYRRGHFAKFEQYMTRPETFPQSVAAATVALNDFKAWHVLLGVINAWSAQSLFLFWQAQQDDPARRQRALAAVVQIVALAASDEVAKASLEWLKPLDNAEFASHLAELESALESPIPNVKKWAMKILGALPDADFDRERAAQTAGEALWSENAGLAKDAAKFLATLAVQHESVAESVWAQLEDATGLENVGLLEAVFRALVKVKSTRKDLELGEAAREKLALLGQVQSERFGKFEKKLAS